MLSNETLGHICLPCFQMCDLCIIQSRAEHSKRVKMEMHSEQALSILRASDEGINAWQEIDDSAYRKQRIELAGKTASVPLLGVTFGVKDIIDVIGYRTGFGSAIYEQPNAPINYSPTVDAAFISLLKSKGALILGKTVTTEFATFKPSATANPAAKGRTPGGSSSGSAAAVAAGMVNIGVGTQTAGSIIRPASYCGVVGFKPSLGSFDLSGVKSLARSFDTIGWFSRTVQESCDLYTILKAQNEPATKINPQSLKIGLCRSPFWDLGNETLAKAWSQLEDLLTDQSSSVQVVEVNLPKEFHDAENVHQTIFAKEAYEALHFEFTNYETYLSNQICKILREGQELTNKTYERAISKMQNLRMLFDSLSSNFDALVTPSAPGIPPRKEEGTGDPIFNRTWSLLGVPAVNVPGLSSDEGYPVGVQVIAGFRQDAKALSVARWLEGRLA